MIDSSDKSFLMESEPGRADGNAMCHDFRLSGESPRPGDERLRRFIDGCPVGVFNFMVSGRIIGANDRFLDMLGYTREDLATGKLDWVEMTPPEYAEQDAAIRDEFVRSGITQPFEKCYIHKNGTRVPVVLACVAMDDPHTEGYAFALDLTLRKQAEEAVRLLNAELEKRVEDRTVMLRRLVGRLATVQDAEQRRIAEGLHDGVAQLLVAASLKLAKLQDDFLHQDPGGRLAEIQRFLAQSQEQIRSLTFELSSATLVRAGLDAALRELCEGMAARYGLSVRFESDGKARPVDSEAGTVIFKSTRELLFNVLKHSGVKEAALSVMRVGPMVRLTVEDRGRGFAIPAHMDTESPGGGLGLFSVHERMRDVRGKMEIESAPGVYTRVSLFVPAALPERSTGGLKPAGQER